MTFIVHGEERTPQGPFDNIIEFLYQPLDGGFSTKHLVG
jgi:hypothetical protein